MGAPLNRRHGHRHSRRTADGRPTTVLLAGDDPNAKAVLG